jgi:hypothetical protein
MPETTFRLRLLGVLDDNGNDAVLTIVVHEDNTVSSTSTRSLSDINTPQDFALRIAVSVVSALLMALAAQGFDLHDPRYVVAINEALNYLNLER